MSRVVFLDTETTGLDPDRHEVWEVAAITEDGTEHTWLLDRVHLAKADPISLGIGGFHERHPYGWQNLPGHKADPQTTNHLQFCIDFGRLTYGAHLVGAVPSFDAAFLRRLFLNAGWQPAWHYHLIDVEAMAVGWLNGRAAGWNKACDNRADRAVGDEISRFRTFDGLPWKSDDLSRWCGVEPPSDDDRHTALGDARWVKRWYEALTGGAS